MVHLTVDLGRFFILLIEQIFWAGMTIGGWLLAALLGIALLLVAARRLRRRGS